MKRATMTDAEYAAAKLRVDSLWEVAHKNREAADVSAREWYSASEPLKQEMRAREIDKFVADAMKEECC